jgi:hypothetical protein
MPLHRRDADQACRHLKHARDLLERDASRQTAVICSTIEKIEQRLSPGDQYEGDAAAEVTVLRSVVEKLHTLKPPAMSRAYGDARLTPAAPLNGVHDALAQIGKAVDVLSRVE